VRRRRPGDRFQPLGLGRPKKLQDFFVDAHVPREERDRVPLVEGDRGIAWVAGQRPAEWAKVTPKTERVLRIRVRPGRA
jgi:tRNA(Ile)-lysidine synthase